MTEQPAVGVKPQDFVKKINSTEGGSLTFAFSDREIVANTIGHLAALPTNLLLWTPDAIGKNPTNDLTHELAERWKDVPFKGDVLVRVGHTSYAGDIQRSFAKDAEMKNALPRFLRVLALPATLLISTGAKILRMDHYNPFTQTATTFHTHREIGMHEIGNAKDFDEHTNWGKIGRSLLRVIPF